MAQSAPPEPNPLEQTVLRGWQPCLKVSTTNKIKISIKNQIFILLWWKKCVKLAKHVIISDNECLGTCFSEKWLADRLLLLKCYDNKMIKLPGCSSIGASSCGWLIKKKKKNSTGMHRDSRVSINAKKVLLIVLADLLADRDPVRATETDFAHPNSGPGLIRRPGNKNPDLSWPKCESWEKLCLLWYTRF